MKKRKLRNDEKESALKAYFYMEKLWADFSSIGLDIGKNENYSALQELIVSQIMENYSNGEDNFLDELSKLAEEKNIQEFLIKYDELQKRAMQKTNDFPNVRKEKGGTQRNEIY